MVIIKNLSYQVLGKVVSMVATAVGIGLITKILGTELYGKYVFIITFLTIFFTFSDWGINTIAVKELSGQKEISKEYFSKVFITRILFSIVMCLLAFLSSILFRLENDMLLAILIGLPMIICYSINSASSIIFQAKFMYKFDFLVRLVYSVISLFFLYYLTIETSNVFLIVFTSVLGWIVSSIFSIYFIKDYLDFRSLKIDYKFSRTLIILTMPIGVALVISTLLSQVDKLIIPSLLNFEQAGFYGLSYKVFEFLLVIPTFFVNSIFIILADKKHNKYIFNYSILILIFTSVVLTFLSIFFAQDIVRLLSNQSFSSSVLPLQFLSLGLLIFFITALLRLQLVFEEKDKLFFYIYFSSLVLNVILNFILLPIVGIIGASIATVLSEVIVLILMVKELNVSVITKENLLFLNKVILVCSLAFLPSIFFKTFGLLLNLALISILLFIFSYAFGLTKQVINLFRGIEGKLFN